jgi:hypothetical protein
MLAAVLLFLLMSDSFSNSTPQFGTAEYATKVGGNRCQFCQQPLGGTYYRVNAEVACPGCADKMRSKITSDTHAAYVRALTYGIGAAVVGLIGYALIAILLQGWVISYMSIGVGWLVATAMMKGSNGVGGRRYQITAVLLTYAAVSMAEIPIWIHFAGGLHVNVMSLGTRLGRLALLGLASPFTQLSGNPFWGLMGLLILFFGMRIAWRIAEGKPFGIFGPFASAQPT